MGEMSCTVLRVCWEEIMNACSSSLEAKHMFFCRRFCTVSKKYTLGNTSCVDSGE